MASLSKVVLSLVVVVVMLLTGFACVDVEAKGKVPGGAGYNNYFKGTVYGDTGRLAGIVIDLYFSNRNPTNPDSYLHQVTVTDAMGSFTLVPSVVSSARQYHLYAGAQKGDGYWTEHHVCELPALAQTFMLKNDVQGYVYPFQAYGNTGHVTEVTLVKELTETLTVRTSLNTVDFEADPLPHYVNYDYTESVSYASGYSGAPNLVCRVPFFFSGQELTQVAGKYLDPVVIEGYFAAKKVPGATPEWGNFLSDWMTGPFGTQTTDWISPGYAYSAYRNEASVTYSGIARFMHGYGPHGTPQTISLSMEITHSSPKAASVFWKVVNLDTVSHRYTYWYDGDIIHIWMSS